MLKATIKTCSYLRLKRVVLCVCSDCERHGGVGPTACSQACTCFVHRLLGWNRCHYRPPCHPDRRYLWWRLRRWLQVRWCLLSSQVVPLFTLGVRDYRWSLPQRILLLRLNKRDSTRMLPIEFYLDWPSLPWKRNLGQNGL